ncbi:MAG: hypothetical protein H7A23_16990 [Leptospiraceae bacterium]|nr:hypothetical protein [Leptospiraceae bacterium]MCP5496244.1 hypothetical protein [Leptospiraceae bacterium]
MKKLTLVFLLLCFCSCAVLSKKNRYTLDFLDENLDPESTGARIALAPVAIPVGITAFVIDGFLIHPIYSLPCAVDDSFWVFREVSNTYVLEIIVFPMRIVTMLATFLGSEIVRITIPIHLRCK